MARTLCLKSTQVRNDRNLPSPNLFECSTIGKNSNHNSSMTRYYAAILFLVSAFVSKASAQETKYGLLRDNNSGVASKQKLGGSGLGNRRLQVSSVNFQEFSIRPTMKDISVNKNGSSAWGIGADGNTYMFQCSDSDNCNRGSWSFNESNGDMSRLEADSISYSGNSKHVWAVANDRGSDGQDLYRGFTVDQWMYRDQPRASLRQISVSFCGKYVYAVDTAGDVWFKEVSGRNEPAWTTIQSSGSRYSYVAVDKGDYVWAIVDRSNRIERYNVRSQRWSSFDSLPSANPKTISVDKASTNVWVVDDRNALWYSDGSGRFTSVSVSSGQKISIASVSGNGKKLFALSVEPYEGDTLVAEIDTRTLTFSTVDEDEDEDCYHPENNSKATIKPAQRS